MTIIYRNMQKEYKARNEELKNSLKESEKSIKNLQTWMTKTNEEKDDLANIFLFIPELISKLTSYSEQKKVFDIVIENIERLFKPTRSYIFIENDGFWTPETKRDPYNLKAERRCKIDEGMLGVAHDLQMIIDKDDFHHLSIDKQNMLLQDPVADLELQVCAPIVYEREVYGIIALSGIQKYTKQKKILVNMLSNLTASAIVNSVLFNEFKHMASSDPLTDLMNKREFEKAILDTVITGSREKRSFSVFIFDIDFFKKYNDTNGHQAGDEALRITGKLIKEFFRKEDFKARYGGEEFIVLLKNTSKEQAYGIAEKFRAKIEQYPYPLEKSQPGERLTISGGVASFPIDGNTSKEIIERADEALYMAKRAGRNRIMKAQAIDFSADLGTEQRRVNVIKIGEKEEGHFPVGWTFSGWEMNRLELGRSYWIVQENGKPIRFSPTIKIDGDTFETEKSTYKINLTG